VCGLNFGVAQLRGAHLRLLHCLLRLHRKFVPTNCHKAAPSFQRFLGSRQRRGSSFRLIVHHATCFIKQAPKGEDKPPSGVIEAFTCRWLAES
jgi:hypothetical protein